VQVDVVGTAMATMDAAGHCRMQVQMRHQCGKLLWIDLSGSRLEAGVPDGADGHTLWMMTGITELQEHHDILTRIGCHIAEPVALSGEQLVCVSASRA
jgi:hypothetical protein